MDPKLRAIQSFGIVIENVIQAKINRVAQVVGTEKFYLNVGGTLFSAGAQIGRLQPDGVVIDKGENVEIKAKKYISEVVKETDEHTREVNTIPAAEVFACVAQIDEFKEVRAEIATIQANKNASQAVRQQTDKEVKEFLDKPDVKEDYKKLKAAQKKVQQATQKMAELEEEHPELVANPTKIATLQASLKNKPADLSVCEE
jgi:hypothetical protein